LLSLYGAQQFTDKWFGQAVLSFGLSHIINKENRRISDSQLAIAKASYDAMSFSSGVLAGYNQGLGNGFVLTPMFGLSYNTLGGISYNILD
jgi:outer membrane autotransporter protein